MIKRESVIQKLARVYLVELTKVVPIEHWRIPIEGRTIGGRNIGNENRGFPDILISYRGHMIGAEAKAPKAKQSENQKKMEIRFNQSQASYFVFHSLDELVSNLQEIALQIPHNDSASRDTLRMVEVRDRLYNKPQIRRLYDLSRASGVASGIGSEEESPAPF